MNLRIEQKKLWPIACALFSIHISCLIWRAVSDAAWAYTAIGAFGLSFSATVFAVLVLAVFKGRTSSHKEAFQSFQSAAVAAAVIFFFIYVLLMCSWFLF